MKFQNLRTALILGLIILILSSINSERLAKEKEFLKDIHDIDEFLKSQYSKNRKKNIKNLKKLKKFRSKRT